MTGFVARSGVALIRGHRAITRLRVTLPRNADVVDGAKEPVVARRPVRSGDWNAGVLRLGTRPIVASIGYGLAITQVAHAGPRLTRVLNRAEETIVTRCSVGSRGGRANTIGFVADALIAGIVLRGTRPWPSALAGAGLAEVLNCAEETIVTRCPIRDRIARARA